LYLRGNNSEDELVNRFSPLLLATAAAACATSAQLPVVTAATPVGVTAPAAAMPTPNVGDVAPDFMFAPIAATGIGPTKKLSDYRGQTVVLWLFIKARTRG
jgi:hypothetical protein